MPQQEAPYPDLRIVPTLSLHPHEEHDSQRALPLIERIQNAPIFLNPPIVAELDSGGDQFVIMDGANRFHAFKFLDYPHILVQVARYGSPFVELKTWRHIVSKWSFDELYRQAEELPNVELQSGLHESALVHFYNRQDQPFSLLCTSDQRRDQNAALCAFVRLYQRQAILHRTNTSNPESAWALFPDATALVVFKPYQADDIIAAAREDALIPPGISRHVIHGRALRINYPMSALRDNTTPLADKNTRLHAWLQHRLDNRAVRYYAEGTYHFDE